MCHKLSSLHSTLPSPTSVRHLPPKDLGTLRRNKVDTTAASFDLVWLGRPRRVSEGRQQEMRDRKPEGRERLPILRVVLRTLLGKAKMCMVSDNADGEVEVLREALHMAGAILFVSASVGACSTAKVIQWHRQAQ